MEGAAALSQQWLTSMHILQPDTISQHNVACTFVQRGLYVDPLIYFNSEIKFLHQHISPPKSGEGERPTVSA